MGCAVACGVWRCAGCGGGNRSLGARQWELRGGNDVHVTHHPTHIDNAHASSHVVHGHCACMSHSVHVAQHAPTAPVPRYSSSEVVASFLYLLLSQMAKQAVSLE